MPPANQCPHLLHGRWIGAMTLYFKDVGVDNLAVRTEKILVKNNLYG